MPEIITSSTRELIKIYSIASVSVFKKYRKLIENHEVCNKELINLYWQVGKYINAKVESAIWGAGVVKSLAAYLKEKEPDLKGFSAQNLWRMKQFYETYRNHEKLSTLLRELPWSTHLHVLAKTKNIEEKEFLSRSPRP